MLLNYASKDLKEGKHKNILNTFPETIKSHMPCQPTTHINHSITPNYRIQNHLLTLTYKCLQENDINRNASQFSVRT